MRIWIGAAIAAGLALVMSRQKKAVSPPKVFDSISPDLEGADRVIHSALNDLDRWGPDLTESDADAEPYLLEYWKSVGWDRETVESYARANGFESWTDVPWSAAWISTIAKGAIAPSGSHIGYLQAAAMGKRPYKLIPLDSPLLPGDIIVRVRSGAKPISYEEIPGAAFMTTHGDLVLEVWPETASVEVIGGNKRNAVKTEELKILRSGTEVIDTDAHPEWFAILRIGSGIPVPNA